MDRKLIAREYIRTRFKYDVLSMVPIFINRIVLYDEYQKQAIVIKVFECFIFFKIYNLAEIISHFDKTFGMLEKYENLAYILRIILILLLNAHFLAILYHSVAMIDIYYIHSEEKDPNAITWISEAGITHASR